MFVASLSVLIIYLPDRFSRIGSTQTVKIMFNEKTMKPFIDPENSLVYSLGLFIVTRCSI